MDTIWGLTLLGKLCIVFSSELFGRVDVNEIGLEVHGPAVRTLAQRLIRVVLIDHNLQLRTCRPHKQKR